MTTDQISAVRSGSGSKTAVTVTVPETGESFTLGGKRAERATVVILVEWNEGQRGLYVYGLRSNADAGRTEAAKLARGGWTVPGARKGTLKVSAAKQAVAIEIMEAVR